MLDYGSQQYENSWRFYETKFVDELLIKAVKFFEIVSEENFGQIPESSV